MTLDKLVETLNKGVDKSLNNSSSWTVDTICITNDVVEVGIHNNKIKSTLRLFSE